MSTQRSVVPSLALIACGLAAPHAVLGQIASSRPASIDLRVSVPPHEVAANVAREGKTSLVRATPNAIDLEALVGLVNRPTSRIEVRLGPNWNEDSTRVWVRNRHGEFEQLLRSATIVALDAASREPVEQSPLRFRVESSRPLTVSTLAIPVEYRFTVGSGDAFTVWSFSSLLQVDSSR